MATGSSTATAVLTASPLSPNFKSLFSRRAGKLSTLRFPAFAVSPKPAPQQDERQRLVRRCTGETIHVENLMSLMPAWFKKIHPQKILDEVNVVIDEWLKTVNLPEKKKRAQRQKGDYVIISSVFYADCSIEKLITLTKYNYWVIRAHLLALVTNHHGGMN
ncbi:hypothetical protein PG997_014211 [Apiospora hydei]|uniref:Uncharacterized protein n=1 Tax=Apiospora hydei TaxID=1337664 RepID=A0ABR1UT51_9PEZI